MHLEHEISEIRQDLLQCGKSKRTFAAVALLALSAGGHAWLSVPVLHHIEGNTHDRMIIDHLASQRLFADATEDHSRQTIPVDRAASQWNSELLLASMTWDTIASLPLFRAEIVSATSSHGLFYAPKKGVSQLSEFDSAIGEGFPMSITNEIVLVPVASSSVTENIMGDGTLLRSRPLEMTARNRAMYRSNGSEWEHPRGVSLSSIAGASLSNSEYLVGPVKLNGAVLDLHSPSQSGLPLASWNTDVRILAYRPTAGWFLIGILSFFAVVLCRTIVAIIRRHHRTRGGRCPRCGYRNIDEISICSECGAGSPR